jgi:hypothetical protein
VDLYEAIRSLHEERKRLSQLICRIEEFEPGHAPSGKPRRRSGGAPRERAISRRVTRQKAKAR